MPEKSFAFILGEPNRLTASWRMGWKDLKIAVDGAPVLSVDNRKTLAKGCEALLRDGRTLSVELESSFLAQELVISVDGKPLPGSSGDPSQRLRSAYVIVYFIAGLSVALGAIAIGFNIEFLLQSGMGGSSILFGAIFALLGWRVKKRSRIALGTAVGLFAADGLFNIVASVSEGATPPVGMLIVKVMFILGMLKGFPAITELNAAETATKDGGGHA